MENEEGFENLFISSNWFDKQNLNLFENVLVPLKWNSDKIKSKL